MTTIKRFKKYKQTIMMGLSLLLIVAFFLPWVKNNPELETFAYSKISISGFELFNGYQEMLPILSGLMQSLEMKAIGAALYLGYLLIVFPIIGIAAIVMSGFRHGKASLVHLIHFSATFSVLFITFLVVMAFGDLRTMFFSIFGFGFGFYLSLLISGIGIGFVVFNEHMK